jgi:uncharacterized Zn-finger protein
MAEELLMKGWEYFISLLPEEKVIHVYKNVDARSKAEKLREEKFYKDLKKQFGIEDVRADKILRPHIGDLVLTNKRLIHLEYRYNVEPLTKKEKLTRQLVNFIGLGLLVSFIGLLFTGFTANVQLSVLFLCLILILFLFGCVVDIKLRAPRLTIEMAKIPMPASYEQVRFEVPLEKIASTESISPTSLTIKMTYKIEEITLDFLPLRFYDPLRGILLISYELPCIEQRKQEVIEFKRNLSLLVYEVQHRPKEIVSYNIVTEFNLNKDGTISVKCPFCGASAPLHFKESEVVCKYCGKTYVVPKKILELIS